MLILTTFDLNEYVYEALRAGASGFLLKDAPADQLVTAIRVVAAGEALLAPSITRRLIEEFARRPPANARPAELAALSPRELEVLRLVARGLSNTEIAGELYVGDATVKTHVARILRNSACATGSRRSCSPTSPGSCSRARPIEAKIGETSGGRGPRFDMRLCGR